MTADLGAYWRKVARAQDFHVRAVPLRERRIRAIDLGKEAVFRNHGQILDFRMFTNLCLSMIVEMDGRWVLALLDALDALGWIVDVDPDREVLERRAADVLEGTFQLTFPEGSRELTIARPAAPW